MDEVATRRAEDQIVIAAMTGLGATSPIRACRHKALPPAIQAQLPMLLDRGIVREGRPGYYYLYAPKGAGPLPPPRTVRRILFAAAFWIFIILMPVLSMYILDK
jgi:hypothetical protein